MPTTDRYQPAAGDHITVRRTSPSGRTTLLTGTVLDILTIDGTPGILHFKGDHGGRVYLATNEQMAAMGYTQTIEPATA